MLQKGLIPCIKKILLFVETENMPQALNLFRKICLQSFEAIKLLITEDSFDIVIHLMKASDIRVRKEAVKNFFSLINLNDLKFIDSLDKRFHFAEKFVQILSTEENYEVINEVINGLEHYLNFSKKHHQLNNVNYYIESSSYIKCNTFAVKLSDCNGLEVLKILLNKCTNSLTKNKIKKLINELINKIDN